METLVKLARIATQMHLELAEETPLRPAPLRPAAPLPPTAPCVVSLTASSKKKKQEEWGVFHAQMPGGKSIPLLKTMLTTACERNCFYCPFRAGRNYRRTSFKPEEMARTFSDMHRAGLVDGLFLSSGIIGGGVRTQDSMLKTVELVRHKHRFGGYIHLKIMPGAEQAQVERAMQLADRLSVNLEAPNDRRLAMLAPMKQFVDELVRPLQWIEQIRHRNPQRKWPSTVTQFVVGAVGESDLELLSTAEALYRQLRIQRAYFSRFNPIRDTPLAHLPAEDPMRQRRLYQSSFLFRDYGFNLEEMPFDEAGNLPLDTDPKLAWAYANLQEDPVEVNAADRESLLRVPGIGPKGAAVILNARRRGALRDLNDLRAIGVRTKRLQPFVLLDGRRPAYQTRLFKDELP